MSTEKLENGKTLEYEQTQGDLYCAQIRGRDGEIESAITCPTMNDVWRWLIREHGYSGQATTSDND